VTAPKSWVEGWKGPERRGNGLSDRPWLVVRYLTAVTETKQELRVESRHTSRGSATEAARALWRSGVVGVYVRFAPSDGLAP
jgi:hypothetical protein